MLVQCVSGASRLRSHQSILAHYLGQRPNGTIELHFTYDEEFGGELGPGWLLKNGLTKPDYLIAAGFSYQVVTAHNGCLQMEVTVHGKMAHAAIPDSGVDALQGANALMTALYAQNEALKKILQTGSLGGGSSGTGSTMSGVGAPSQAPSITNQAWTYLDTATNDVYYWNPSTSSWV